MIGGLFEVKFMKKGAEMLFDKEFPIWSIVNGAMTFLNHKDNGDVLVKVGSQLLCES